MNEEDLNILQKAIAELPYTTVHYEKLLKKNYLYTIKCSQLYMRQKEDAEEIASEVWIKVFRYLPKMTEPKYFKSWLYKIIKNTCFTALEKRKKNTAKKQEALHVAQMAQDSVVPFTEGGDLPHYLNILKEEDRELLILRFVYDYTIEEISAELSLGLSATKMRLYRAVEKINLEFKVKKDLRGTD